jgi:hypothetical protein
MIQLRALHALVLLCLLSPSGFILADSFDTEEAETSRVERFRDGLEELEVEELSTDEELDVLDALALQRRMQFIDAEMLRIGEAMHDVRIDLREERNSVRLVNERVAEINAEIVALRREIERVVDEVPTVRVILDDLAEREKGLVALVNERRRILERLQRIPHEELEVLDALEEDIE